MVLEPFSADDLARMCRRALDSPEAMPVVIERLREIANLEGHSYGAVRMANEALRALGANVPLSRSERLRYEPQKDNALSLVR
ncbi:MAG: hypothetical protein CTY31_10665 [Hyphomicrobium sp.]|nr:MAG: hypothetical protein CTY31_10665 [Hyphomicrobium sp.]